MHRQLRAVHALKASELHKRKSLALLLPIDVRFTIQSLNMIEYNVLGASEQHFSHGSSVIVQ